MTNVATDLLGKRVAVYTLPDWHDAPGALPRHLFTGVVRAVSFGDYHPHHTHPAFHLLVQADQDQDRELRGMLRVVTLGDRYSVVPELSP